MPIFRRAEIYLISCKSPKTLPLRHRGTEFLIGFPPLRDTSVFPRLCGSKGFLHVFLVTYARGRFNRGVLKHSKFKEAKKPCRAHATVPGNVLQENLTPRMTICLVPKKVGLIFSVGSLSDETSLPSGNLHVPLGKFLTMRHCLSKFANQDFKLQR